MTKSLSALTFCADPKDQQVLCKCLEAHKIKPWCCASVERATGAMNQQKFDLGLIDLDSLPDGYLTELQRTDTPGYPSILIALSISWERLRALSDNEAQFRLQKPMHAHQILKTLKIAIGQLADERHSGYRHSVNVGARAVLMVNGKERNLRGATIINISYTGLCLFCEQSLPIGETIAVHFYLPSTGKAVRLSGRVIWCDSNGHAGLEFQEIAPLDFRRLRDWLRMMSTPSLSHAPVMPLSAAIEQRWNK
ncbi:MAG TPA: PilZ domain-containing protein [Candidatus Angelobacter sp.]|nr:PilZ domain-containing protein [Candidatus Angelobacter sp.]